MLAMTSTEMDNWEPQPVIQATKRPHLILLDDFRRWQQTRRLAKHTISERERVLRMMAIEAGVQPAHATYDEISDWIASRDDLSDSTIAKYLGYLRAWYTWLQRYDHRLDNPMVKIDPPKVPDVEPRPVTDNGLVNLLSIRMHYRTRIMILLGSLQGLRAFETAKVRGVDFDTDTMKMRVFGKGKKERTIPLHPLVAHIVPLMPRGFWFPGADSGHVHSDSVSAIISAAMRRAGIAGRPHGLRGWCATTMLDEGANLRQVQRMLRHAMIATTQRYTLPSDDGLLAEVRKLDPFRGRNH